jgi:hypothetical protein
MSDYVHDFARIRVQSTRHMRSVTADITFESYLKVDPHDAAAMASDDLFTVVYVGQPNGGLPTFNVSMKGEPKDAEVMLRTIAARLEAGYDDAAGEQLLR